MVAYMDKIIGRIVARLDELGLRENTLLLFTGDNGTPRPITSKMKDGRSIRGGKGLTTDAGTHVALIANFKGTIYPGRLCSDLVDFSDFLPTLADAARASIPAGAKIDGRSFMPQLLGKKASPRDSIFCWYRRDPGKTLFRFARDKRFKLYDKGDYPRAGKLYDVQADPLEQSPIEPGRHSDVRKRLRAVLNSMK
jgi:arylsulfatase A